ncbi:MAG: hypothetical protein JSR77_11265 [Planctomycetes bacterium]|nr:hypothetical protein [Planctomycetota bacterium]
MTTRPNIAVWTDPARIASVRALASRAGCDIAMAGTSAKGQATAVASELGVPVADDLRRCLSIAPCAAVVIVSPGDFGAAADDARAVLAARARGVAVLCLEPVPANAMELVSAGWLDESSGAKPADALRFAPLPRLGAAFTQAAEIATVFGEPRTMHVQVTASTLGAALFQGADLLAGLLGEPESIDAAYTSPLRGAVAGDSLRNLHGELTGVVRFADGRAAGLALAEGEDSFRCTMLSAQGRLTLTEKGCEWLAPDGSVRDRLETRDGGWDASAALVRAAGKGSPDTGPVNLMSLLAFAQAALLSSRTGHPERPAGIRHALEA